MIRLNVSEQQLFDMIMAVYAAGNAEDAEKDETTTRRREALLDKLHRAFDAKIISHQPERPAGAVRIDTRSAHAGSRSVRPR